MAVVISNKALEKHNVNTYNFKILAMGSNQLEEQENVTSSQVSHPQETRQAPIPQEPFSKDMTIDSSEMSQDSRNALIESLMKKTEEMTSNFIKLQMKLEAKDEEHKIALQSMKEESFAQGMQEQAKIMQENEEANKHNAVTQFSNSIATLENAATEFSSALEGIKSELMIAALDIAKEVVQVELKQSSNEIAKALAANLIAELQGASKITLKVYLFLTSHSKLLTYEVVLMSLLQLFLHDQVHLQVHSSKP